MDGSYISGPPALSPSDARRLPRLVSLFRNSLHFRRESFERISEPSDTRIPGLLVSYESEVRFRGCRQMGRNFGFGTLALDVVVEVEFIRVGPQRDGIDLVIAFIA